jgi:Tol biopolymer transport system component
MRAPVWSPDGTRIAFYDVHTYYGWIDEVGVDVIDATGANQVTLVHERSAPKSKGSYVFDGNLDWSPDGTMILFGAAIQAWGGGGGSGDASASAPLRDGRGDAPGQTGQSSPLEVYRMSAADGSALRCLTDDTDALLLPVAWR